MSLSAVGAHLVAGVIGLSVRDGAQASEVVVVVVAMRLGAVPCRMALKRPGRLNGANVVCGFIRPPPSQMRQVGEAQLFGLQ